MNEKRIYVSTPKEELVGYVFTVYPMDDSIPYFKVEKTGITEAKKLGGLFKIMEEAKIIKGFTVYN